MRLAAKRRVVKDLLRAVARREERQKLVPEKKPKVPRAGRPVRWPGMCKACCMRHFGEAGGPMHDKKLCESTQKLLKRGKVKC